MLFRSPARSGTVRRGAERSGRAGSSGEERAGAAMGKVQLFEIRLGESRVIYSPGEPLAGTVTVRLSGSLQYRAIKVSCVGFCGVSNKINDTAWTVEEQYFNSTLSLADKGELGGDLWMCGFLLGDD